MNTIQRGSFDCRRDLQASRDVAPRTKGGFEMLLNWFELWRVPKGLGPEIELAREFWRSQVRSKPRQEWQLEQWTEAIHGTSAG
jgi:hypothetical protein